MSFEEDVKAGDIEAVRTALEADQQLAYSSSEDGTPLLMLAKYFGHSDIANEIASKRRTLNMHEAASMNNVNQLLQAIDSSGDVDGYSTDGFTSLGFACYFGNFDAAQTLLDAGADPNLAYTGFIKAAPLHSALSGKHSDIVQLLLERGASPLAPSGEGWTPLHYAAHNGDSDLVRYFLSKGANLQARSKDGKTPLDLANEQGFVSVSALLA